MNIVKFSDVVKRVNINIDKDNTHILYYVGGEHIESNEFMVHNKGLIKGATIGYKFHYGFKPGHILFMSRNPHLQKASMVDFEGVCSDSTYVVETKDSNVLLQDYLLLELQSERFWKWAEENKSGGVNYLINYCTLNTYEFSLPDIEQQKELVSKAWAAYRLKESYKRLLEATREMVKSQFIEMFGNPMANNRSWPTKTMSEVAPEDSSSTKLEGKVWILNLDMVESQTGHIIGKVYDDSSNLLSVASFDEGNVLLSKLRPYLNKVVNCNDKGYATTELVALRPDQNVLNKVFFTSLLRGDEFVNYANSIATGTKMPRLPLSNFRKLKCITPPLPLQEQFAAIYEQADKSEFELKKSIEAIDAVIKSLINN